MITKTTNNRSILAGILLVLFLQVIFVKSLHYHHFFNSIEISCDNTTVIDNTDRCVICLFSFQPFEEALDPPAEILRSVFPELSIIYRERIYDIFSCNIDLRAPPFSPIIFTGEV